MQPSGFVAAGASGSEALLSVAEAAKALNVSKATVYKLCEQGKLDYHRVSAQAIRIARGDLAAFLRRSAHAPR